MPSFKKLMNKVRSPTSSPTLGPASSHGAPSVSLQCNICHDGCADPVLTLCGHLYCWPCIYSWMRRCHQDGVNSTCAVCHAPVTAMTCIPVYGAGCSAAQHSKNRTEMPRDMSSMSTATNSPDPLAKGGSLPADIPRRPTVSSSLYQYLECVLQQIDLEQTLYGVTSWSLGSLASGVTALPFILILGMLSLIGIPVLASIALFVVAFFLLITYGGEDTSNAQAKHSGSRLAAALVAVGVALAIIIAYCST